MPRLTFFLLLLAITASAQFVPPVPKTIGGGRGLHRTREIPLPAPNERWVRGRSAHFLTLSGASQSRTRDVVTQLESVAAALQKLDPHFAAEGEPARVFLFARGRDAAPYFDLILGYRTPGVFLREPGGNGTMLIDGTRTFAGRTVFHELVHDLLANRGTRLPLWLEEGIAEYFSTAEVSEDRVRFGKPIDDHFALLRSRPLMPIDALFAADASSPMAGTGYFYAEAWSVVDSMMRMDRTAFYAFLNDVANGAPSADAFRARFRAAPATAEQILQSVQIRPAAIVTVQLDHRPDPPSIEPLQHDDVVIELATFLGSFEATRGDAERFLKSIDQNARAVAALAEVRSRDKRYGEATRLFERAIELDPQNADIRLRFAESLLGNAIGPFAGTSDVEAGDAPQFRRARQLATDAMASGADASRANTVIGTSYLVESDVQPGIDALQRALATRPNRYDAALNLYALLLRSGQEQPARKLYDDIAARARTPQAIFAAKAVFVREQLSLTNHLLAQGRTDDAIAVLKQLIAVTPDANAKADLQRQLMKITEVGEANRQVMTYNEAVNAANAGDTEKAIGILDQLLKTATDPQVISDATAFRARLQKRLKGMRRSRGTL